jgi:serine/threonine protein phosphatase 1
MSRLIAIGDVHGCIHALEALLEAIAPTADDTLVFLGDLIDFGRDARDVLEAIIKLQHQCHVVLIQGNHEEMMFWARGEEKALHYWENHGGVPTLNSYNFPGKITDIPAEHWNLLSQCVPFYETPDFIFTHAHYQPELPMSEQSEHELRWTLLDPAEIRPHVSGKPVIVGHTEQRDSEVLDLGYVMCIDTACWRYGWLTAIECHSGYIWQASKWGILRAEGEANHMEPMKTLMSSHMFEALRNVTADVAPAVSG